ncbi:SDR family NAD(P)-dependent oxidoreductase [Streptomyces stramineus]|uniref:SDR family NAD(P)-dependent oxidoreductase n=1 Tax=Streptomyces stramineus TaxID=173861 RepID=UPI0031DE176F
MPDAGSAAGGGGVPGDDPAAGREGAVARAVWEEGPAEGSGSVLPVSAARGGGAPGDDPDAGPAAPEPLLAGLATALRAELRAAGDGPVPLDGRPGLRPALNRLCAALARDCLAGGVRDQDVLPQFRRLHDFLRTLADEAPAADAATLVAEVTTEHPEFAGLVELLTHCAGACPRALTVPGAALEALYPAGDAALLRRTLGERTADHRATGRLTALTGTLLDRLAARHDRPIRVLEVGAGEGNLTRELATRAPGRLDYHATDVSRLFVTHLAEEAARRGLDFVRTRVLDISQEPGEQGFAGEHFDLVCGLDVVHAAPDLRAALGHLGSLLAPGGTLALIETTAADPWLSMIWGLTDGWWNATDRRTHGPLLDADGWRALVAGEDFAATDVIVPETGARDAALVLAERAPRPLPAAGPGGARDVSTWCHLPGWRHAAPPRPADVSGTCLLLGGGATAKAVATRLEALGVDVTAVGEPPAEYEDLLGDAVRLVVHLWPMTDALRRGRAAGPGTAAAAQGAGLHSLLELARAFGARPERHPVRLLTVTAGAQEILGDDLLHPEHATVASAAKVIPREYPWIACTAMDVPANPDGTVGTDGTDHDPTGRLADRIVEELRAARETTLVAYRGRRRFVPGHAPLTLPAPAERARIRPGGVYLICGGTGGIGLHLAGHLAQAPATVVLTHRRPLPPREDWERLPAHHPEADLVRRLRRIEATGGRVFPLRADLTDPEAMRALTASVERDHGPVRGVVHAAGVPDTAGMIQRRDRAATDTAMAAKLLGALVLDDLFADHDLDFFVLCSSIGTVLHKLKFGEVGYVAGNDFLNAFAAHRAARRPGRTLSVSWTDWRESGMWASAQRRLTERYGPGAADAPGRPGGDLLGALTPREGVELFDRLLAADTGPNVLVSTQDLGELLARHAAYTTDDHLAALGELRIGPGRDTEDRTAPYKAPRTPAERRIADWFRDLLGVRRAGLTDDFFSLGGDSLLALRLLSQLRDAYGTEISIARMFDDPTVAGLAAAVDRHGQPPPAAPPGQEEVVL